MKRTKKELTVAQDVIESLIAYCLRHDIDGLDIDTLRATVATLELEKMR